MNEERPAFGGMLADLVELGAIEFRPEPLDAIVERRLKAIWAARSCPNCGAASLGTVDQLALPRKYQSIISIVSQLLPTAVEIA
jgi:hypothetical protein